MSVCIKYNLTTSLPQWVASVFYKCYVHFDNLLKIISYLPSMLAHYSLILILAIIVENIQVFSWNILHLYPFYPQILN